MKKSTAQSLKWRGRRNSKDVSAFFAQSLWVVGLAFWVVVISYGFSRLFIYEATPGSISSIVPAVWPSNSALKPSLKIPVLLMLVHPVCPCSRASVSELEKMMTPLQGKVRAYVVFVKPHGFSNEQVQSNLWKKAEKIPGVQVFLDEGNKEAALFGGKISGETFLYGTQGQLLFHGGITEARGHEGENAGSESVTDFVLKGKAAQSQTLTFGCSLWDRKTRKDIYGK